MKVETPTTRKREYNRLPKYAFTWQLLSEKEEQTFKKCFASYQDVLEGTYNCVGYYEYLLFTEEMIECLEENIEEEIKTFKKYQDFVKLLIKLGRICDKRKIGRLFFVLY